MTSPFTFREGLLVGGLAVLCAAAGIAMLTEGPSSESAMAMAAAVDFMRLWTGS